MTAIEKAIDSIKTLPEELAEKTVSFIKSLSVNNMKSATECLINLLAL